MGKKMYFKETFPDEFGKAVDKYMATYEVTDRELAEIHVESDIEFLIDTEIYNKGIKGVLGILQKTQGISKKTNMETSRKLTTEDVMEILNAEMRMLKVRSIEEFKESSFQDYCSEVLKFVSRSDIDEHQEELEDIAKEEAGDGERVTFYDVYELLFCTPGVKMSPRLANFGATLSTIVSNQEKIAGGRLKLSELSHTEAERIGILSAPCTKRRLLGFRNVGKKTISELQELVKKHYPNKVFA